MKKPGASFAFQPRNNISDETPGNPKLSYKTRPQPGHDIFKRFGSNNIMVNERAPPKGPLRAIDLNEDAVLPKEHSEKAPHAPADADALAARLDALRVSSSSQQTGQTHAANSGARRAESPDVVEVPRSAAPKESKPRPKPSQQPQIPSIQQRDDALSAFFSDRGARDPFHAQSTSSSQQNHVFGRPTKMMSSLKQKAAGVFNERKSRPEHHRDNNRHKISVPTAPTYQDRKANAPNLYSSMGPDSGPPVFKPTEFGEPEFYTDPNKASADLKALLEGGMEGDDDEDKEAIKEAEQDEKDGSLEGIKVKLLPHQVEGVDWMRGRELGPVKRGRVPKGGILADDMGLGKTLQTISLILSNQMPAKDEKGWKKHFASIERTTLVVAPLALIRQWESEIKDKVAKSHGLKVCVHHGPQRTKRFKDLAQYDVVVTTYQVLVSEYGQSSEADEGLKVGCFGLHWWRVVLDEAHTIKNRNAKSTKACYALRSEYRWCLSGTPMQNNLEELQSLIRFLRIKPYDNLAEWKDQIEKPMKNGKGHVAIRRLHSLLRCFMKRRTKAILREDGALNPGGKPTREGEKSANGFKVTERKVVTVKSQFSPAERRFYDRMAARADESIERMQKGGMNYANALVLLLRLRQACNHPKLVEGKLDKDKDALSGEASQKTTDADIDGLADMFGGMGIVTKTCSICGRDLPADLAKSGQEVCKECYADLAYFNENKGAKSKRSKRKKGQVKPVVGTPLPDAAVSQQKQHRPRNRNAIIDSDDEEASASWLVPEDQQGSLRLGKAGGEDDENAEGGGEWLGTEDSLHHSEQEGEGSQLDSFVVNDQSQVKAEQDILSDLEDSFASISVIASQADRKPKAETSDAANQSDCDSDLDGSSEDVDTGVDESEVYSEEDETLYHKTGKASAILASAKIRQMMQILHKEAHEHKFIVFSQFTSMMDLVEPFFRKEGLKFTRYDGSMKNDEREASLQRLRNDNNTRILLCSLKCGSLGLNLTAATRVIIVEPFWNPFVEEQAIDRVHRLTQTVDVIIYKLTVEQTVEERILELQEKKRLLAETAIEGGMKKDVLKLGFKEIMDLFRRDGGQPQPQPQPHSQESDRPGASRSSSQSDVTRRELAKAKPKRAEDSIYGRRW